MVDQDAPMEARFAVFRYYGSFSATLLTMFEVHLPWMVRLAPRSSPLDKVGGVTLSRNLAQTRQG